MSFEPQDQTPTMRPVRLSGTGAHVKRAHRLLLAFGGFVVTVLLTFLGLLAITFFIGRVIPIDPVLSAVGDRATPAVYNAAKQAMGLDKPLIVQFISYVADIAQGHFGMSVSTGRPVIEDLSRFFPATLEMATIGIIIGVMLGVPMGVYAASRQGTLARSDHPRFRPARLLGARLLARPRRSCRLLRPSRMGRRAGTARHLL